MAKPKGDSIVEERIQNEAVVDAYGPEEQVGALSSRRRAIVILRNGE